MRIPTNMHTIGMLSSCLTLITSVTNIILSVIVVVFHNNCLLNTLFRVYILKDECPPQSLKWEGVTNPSTVYVLILSTLIAAIVTFIASIALITVFVAKGGSRHVHLVAYIYIGVCLGSLVVDFITAIYFGMDYTTMNLSTAGLDIYTRDMVRLTAFVVMTAHFVTIVLLFLLVIFIIDDYQKEQSLPNQSALISYDTPMPGNEWPQIEIVVTSPSPRGGALEMTESWQPVAYLEEAKQPKLIPVNLAGDQELNRTWTCSGAFEMTESWQPVAYLEEATQPSPARLPIPVNLAGDQELNRTWTCSGAFEMTESWQPVAYLEEATQPSPARLPIPVNLAGDQELNRTWTCSGAFEKTESWQPVAYLEEATQPSPARLPIPVNLAGDQELNRTWTCSGAFEMTESWQPVAYLEEATQPSPARLPIPVNLAGDQELNRTWTCSGAFEKTESWQPVAYLEEATQPSPARLPIPVNLAGDQELNRTWTCSGAFEKTESWQPVAYLEEATQPSPARLPIPVNLAGDQELNRTWTCRQERHSPDMPSFPAPDYSPPSPDSGAFEKTESWQPVAYLEEATQPSPARLPIPVNLAGDQELNRTWTCRQERHSPDMPSFPAPDYSPPSPDR